MATRLTVVQAQICFIGVMLLMVLLTSLALLSSNWKQFDRTSPDNAKFLPTSYGLLTHTCPGANPETSWDTDERDFCKRWYFNRPWWEKTAEVCLVMALVAEGVAIANVLLTMTPICLLNRMIPMFPVLAIIVLFIAVIVYGVNNKTRIVLIQASSNKEAALFLRNAVKDSSIGLGYWLAVLAILTGAVAVVVGGGIIYANNKLFVSVVRSMRTTTPATSPETDEKSTEKKTGTPDS